MNLSALEDRFDDWIYCYPRLKKIYLFFYRKINKIFFDIPREIKWFFQRIFRGYDDTVAWSFYWYFIHTIRNPFKFFVKNYKKHGIGCPGEFFDSNAKNNDECKEWVNLLEKIEKAFDMLYDKEEFNESYEKTVYGKDGMKIEKFNTKKAEEYDRQIQEGLDLFAKHLAGFWD